MAGFYDFSAILLDGREQPMSDYADRVLLVVNVASQCGLTPQYRGLEELYRRYSEDGLTILAFPCNQFGMQEPGTELEIAAFCRVNYDVTFPIFSKVRVNGRQTHPIFRWLKRQAPGLLGIQTIPWNFTKFLVDRSGLQVTRFASSVEPAELVPSIENLLAAPPTGNSLRASEAR